MKAFTTWGAAAWILCAAQASAQTPAPTPEALSLARTLVQKTNSGRLGVMSGLSLPMAKVMHELAVGPDHANVVLHEAVMPTLADHEAELTDIQVTSTATALSVDDMKAAIAFYNTLPGRHLVQAKPEITGTNMLGVNKLIDQLLPAFKTRTQDVLKAHGWAAK